MGQQAEVWDVRSMLHYRISVWFATLQYAYQFKTALPPDASNLSIKLGRAISDFYFDVWYEIYRSHGGLDYQGQPAPFTFRELGMDFQKVGASTYVQITPLSGIYTGFSYVVDGRNIGKEVGFFAGLVWKIDGESNL